IKHRIPIALRPAAAADRANAGHWEGDLMLFRTYGQAILTLHERSSRALILVRRPNKAAAPLAAEIQRLFVNLPRKLRQTITFDNGTEFAHHHLLRRTL